jgi:SAM-dependent methyltransferase
MPGPYERKICRSVDAMSAQQLLEEIANYCREARVAETTFGRQAVNDGKLVQRLRQGGRITTDTLERIRSFLAERRTTAGQRAPAHGPAAGARTVTEPPPSSFEGRAAEATTTDPQRNFRFFDNRQKYLLFVGTCSEKRVIANRVALELANIHPRPPAVRVFDAGVGDGTVLTRVMRAMHGRFPHMPFYITGKEISLEDVRLTLDKMPDRFFEHPATVFVLTNMYYAEAPWLTVRSPAAANSMVWHELRLTGTTSAEFERQIADLQSFLAENWRARISPKSGNPVYERPVALVIYRDDHRFLLDPVIPHPGRTEANFDLVIASQPYRARASAEFKAKRVISPLARALRPGGRLIAIHSCGNDPGMEIIQRIWPGDNPFVTNRHQVLQAVKQDLGPAGRELNFNAYSDSRSIFQYRMEALPNEVAGPIGTSTLFAAWNAAIYVAQIEDDRLNEVVKDRRYLEVTHDVLRKHGGLWFNDESFVISRRRE